MKHLIELEAQLKKAQDISADAYWMVQWEISEEEDPDTKKAPEEGAE